MNISKEEYEQAKNNIIDEETGMTLADLWEWEFGDNLTII